jgi:hypothetical protein
VVGGEPVPVVPRGLQAQRVGVDGQDHQDAAGREQAAQHPQVVDRARQMRHHGPERDDVEAASGDLRHVARSAEVRVLAARSRARVLDRLRREVDPVAVEAALVGQLEEEARAAAEVEQPASRAVGEQLAERVHHHPVAALALAPVPAGQELVVLAGVQLAEPLRPDPRVAVEEAARGAAHDVVAPPPVLPLGREQRLHGVVAAERAGDHLLDVAHPDALGVLGGGHLRRAEEPPAPAGLVERRGGGHGVGPQLLRRQRPRCAAAYAVGELDRWSIANVAA